MRRILLISLLFVTSFAVAQIPKAKKKTFVNDYANVLTAGDIKGLNQKIYIIQKQAGVQLAVVLVDKIPAAYTIKTFANKIGSKWHVGKNKKGLVYVAALQQHQQRIAVASNLDTVFTTAKCEAILADMKTAYRNNDYNGGLTILVNRVHNALIAPVAPVAGPQPQTAAAKPAIGGTEKEDNSLPILVGLTVLGLIILFIFRYFKNRSRRQMEAFYAQQYNQGPGGPGGGYGGGGYGGGGGYRGQRRRGSGVGGFVAGAALGAAGGYAARYIQDKMNENDGAGVDTPNNFAQTPITEDNNESNWGNWGSGDTGDSGFADDSSDSSSSYDSGSSSYDSGSSSDSGFSSDSGSSDSGASSSW